MSANPGRPVQVSNGQDTAYKLKAGEVAPLAGPRPWGSPSLIDSAVKALGNDPTHRKGGY